MREVYLLNEGDTLEKVKYDCGDGQYRMGEDKILGKKYMVLNAGGDDITVIRNYMPLYISHVKEKQNVLDIMSSGFNIVASQSKDIEVGDMLILNRPKSVRYVVSPLESLDTIANKFGVEKSIIMSSNNLKTDKLFVGQILWI